MPNILHQAVYSHLCQNGPLFEKSNFWGIYSVLTWMFTETNLKFMLLRSFWYVYQKNPSTPSWDMSFLKYPPLKTALLKRRVKRPSVFINCLIGFLAVRITITNQHINYTIDFFLLWAKNQKKTASDSKI